jgi:hypothetical protein
MHAVSSCGHRCSSPYKQQWPMVPALDCGLAGCRLANPEGHNKAWHGQHQRGSRPSVRPEKHHSLQEMLCVDEHAPARRSPVSLVKAVALDSLGQDLHVVWHTGHKDRVMSTKIAEVRIGRFSAVKGYALDALKRQTHLLPDVSRAFGREMAIRSSRMDLSVFLTDMGTSACRHAQQKKWVAIFFVIKST